VRIAVARAVCELSHTAGIPSTAREQRVQIRRVDAYAVHYTHRHGPFTMSGGRVSTGQEGTLVRVEADNGVVGWGECCVISPDYAPGYAPATRAALGLLASALLGSDPRQPDVVYARLETTAKGYAEAKSALDMACWDAFGRFTGMRLAELLGGVHQEEFPLYTVVGIGAPDEMRARVDAATTAGYRCVQLKVGTTVRADVARVEACAAAGGTVDALIVDANAYYPLAEGVRLAAALDELDVYLEQPCASLEECAQVRRSSHRPLVLDETLWSVQDVVRAYGLSAGDALRLKLVRFGGITPVRRARDLAVSLGYALTIEDAGGGDVVSAALAHLAASVPTRFLLAGYLPSEMNAEHLAISAPVAVDGRARLPDGPGLGIEVNEDALEGPILSVR
jgi:L-alanine-DL-glutamate epimerase-like enolase superfamily enzyme